MNLEYSDSDVTFRTRAREFLEANLPPDLGHKVLSHKRLFKDDFRRWHEILARQGWVAPAWPIEYGGTDWTPVQRHIWDDECNRIGAPPILSFAISMLGPMLIEFGSDAQKKKYLPRILSCEDWWCQGYSEPGAGSDLAALKTRAKYVSEDGGDFYIVNGQKTWTSYAHYAEMMFCLVRTDNSGRKQEGISFLLIDMGTPGITVRPIITLDEEHEVNEVFFDNVKVPAANLVGDENKGWTYAKYILSHERSVTAEIGRNKRELSILKQICAQHFKGSGTVLNDPVFANKIAQLEIELMSLEVTVLRVIYENQQKSEPGPQVSLLKVVGTEIQQRLTELMLEAVGPYGLPFDLDYIEGRTPHSISGDDDSAPLAAYYFNYRKTSIYGGSNEIQKNILTRTVLGL